MKKLLLLALCVSAVSCSYNAETGEVFITIDGIPGEADHLDVVVTDSAAKDIPYRPSFQPGAVGSSLQMQIKAPAAPGTFTVKATASYKDDLLSSAPPEDGVVPGKTELHITLHASGGVGTYATPCSTAAGSTPCVAGLTCKVYASGTSEVGFCTISCASTAACPTTSPAPECDPFAGSGTQGFCQWNCTVGGSCPTGLTCKSVGSGQSFCTGF